jgi:hypothetical protein
MPMYNPLTKLNLASLEAQEFAGDKEISLIFSHVFNGSVM